MDRQKAEKILEEMFAKILGVANKNNFEVCCLQYVTISDNKLTFKVEVTFK